MQFKQITATCPNGCFLRFPTSDGREMYTSMYTLILKLAL